MKNEQQWERHRLALVALAAFGLEHGLRLLPKGDPTRELIEGDIYMVRDDHLDLHTRYRESKRRRKSYTVPGLLLQGAEALLRLATRRGYPRGKLVQSVWYFPAEAAYLARGSEQAVENEFQKPLYEPLDKQWGDDSVVQDILDKFGTRLVGIALPKS